MNRYVDPKLNGIEEHFPGVRAPADRHVDADLPFAGTTPQWPEMNDSDGVSGIIDGDSLPEDLGTISFAIDHRHELLASTLRLTSSETVAYLDAVITRWAARRVR
jgi:hypothetical protein